jgi:hypothetical protein
LAELQLKQGDVPNGSLWSLGGFLVSQTAKIALGSVAPTAVAGLIEQNGSSLSAKDIGNIGLTRSFSLPRKGIILKSVCGIGATAGCIALPIFCPIIGIAGTICRMLPF